jgi:hypothetical protein
MTQIRLAMEDLIDQHIAKLGNDLVVMRMPDGAFFLWVFKDPDHAKPTLKALGFDVSNVVTEQLGSIQDVARACWSADQLATPHMAGLAHSPQFNEDGKLSAYAVCPARRDPSGARIGRPS